MKVSVTIEQVAANLGTTLEFAKEHWMKVAISENGFVFFKADKYVTNEVDKKIIAIGREIVPADFADDQELKNNVTFKAQLKTLYATAVTLEEAFATLN